MFLCHQMFRLRRHRWSPMSPRRNINSGVQDSFCVLTNCGFALFGLLHRPICALLIAPMFLLSSSSMLLSLLGSFQWPVTTLFATSGDIMLCCTAFLLFCLALVTTLKLLFQPRFTVTSQQTDHAAESVSDTCKQLTFLCENSSALFLTCEDGNSAVFFCASCTGHQCWPKTLHHHCAMSPQPSLVCALGPCSIQTRNALSRWTSAARC